MGDELLASSYDKNDDHKQEASFLESDNSLYAVVLNNIINPLTTCDFTDDPKLHDLSQKVKQIYGVNERKHKYCTQELKKEKPMSVKSILQIEIFEGENILPQDENNNENKLFCFLMIKENNDGENSRNSGPPSPKSLSPSESPPAFRRSKRFNRSKNKLNRKGSKELLELTPSNYIASKLASAECNPVWYEELALPLTDIENNELLILIWRINSDQVPSKEFIAHWIKSKELKSLLKQFASGSSSENTANELVGHCAIPLSELNLRRPDIWYDINFSSKFRKKNMAGALRVGFSLSYYERNNDSNDSDGVKEINFLPIEDFHEIVQQIYLHEIYNLSKSHKTKVEDDFEKINELSQEIIDQIASQHDISPINKMSIELSVVLEYNNLPTINGIAVSELFINDLINRMNEEYDDRFKFHDKSREELDCLLTPYEANLLNHVCMSYFDEMLSDFVFSSPLFPTDGIDVDEINFQMRNFHTILSLKVWTKSDMACGILTTFITTQLKEDTFNWINDALKSLQLLTSCNEHCVLQQADELIELITVVNTLLQPVDYLSSYFNIYNIDYFMITTSVIETAISKATQLKMAGIDQYHVTYQQYDVNLQLSVKISLCLYFAVKDLIKTVRRNFQTKDLYRASIMNYNQWFTNSVMYWLQKFQQLAMQRMEKALMIDKDLVLVTSSVRFSNSSVDVKTLFTQMIIEWRKIEYEDADISLLGITKIIDTICDCSRQYCIKLTQLLETQQFVDDEGNKNIYGFTDQLCIAINNAEQIRLFLKEIPSLLNITDVSRAFSIKYESETVGEQSLEVIYDLLKCANDDILTDMSYKLNKLIELLTEELHSLMRIVLSEKENMNTFDECMLCIRSKLKIITSTLEPTILPNLIDRYWNAFISMFKSLLWFGRNMFYYESKHSFLLTFKHVVSQQSDHVTSLETESYKNLVKHIELNMHSSEDLMLLYLKSLVNKSTSFLQHGSIAIKMAYKKISEESVSLIVKVCGCRSLPGLKRGVCNSFVSVTLSPLSIFKEISSSTEIIKQSTNPQYDKIFTFEKIPSDFLSKDGACIIFTVWHHESFGPRNVIGEHVEQLSEVKPIVVDGDFSQLPVKKMRLKKFERPIYGPFNILKERASWDLESRKFVSQRSYLAGYNHNNPSCISWMYSFASL